MMPRPKKAAHEVVDKRNGQRLALVPSETSQAPEPPPGLLKTTREAWDTYWSDSVAALIQPGEVPLVRRYFLYVDEHDRALRAYRAQRMTNGSMGQPVLSPMFKVVTDLETKISALEDRLGISPKSRLALGIAVGQAQKSLAELNAAMDTDDSDSWVVLSEADL